MNAVETLQYVLGTILVLVIFAPLLLATPIGGMGSLPFFGGDAIWMVTFLPILLPVLILLFVATILLAQSEDSTSVTSNENMVSATPNTVVQPTQTRPARSQPQQTNTSTASEYDGTDPVEILRERYANGDITHEEYEMRLQVLLDADDTDELRERIEWASEQEAPPEDDEAERTDSGQ